MKVEKNKPSFQANLISKSTCLIPKKPLNFKLYELSLKDQAFLNATIAKIDLPTLYPNLKEEKYDIWTDLMDGFISDKSGRHTYLLTCNKKPCGTITYQDQDNDLYLESMCTWPIKKGQKVTCAGKVLVENVLKNFVKSDKENIKLEAITYGPFPLIRKYMGFGFKKIKDDGNGTVEMVATKTSAQKTLEKFSKLIKTTDINNTKEVDLFEVLG